MRHCAAPEGAPRSGRRARVQRHAWRTAVEAPRHRPSAPGNPLRLAHLGPASGLFSSSTTPLMWAALGWRRARRAKFDDLGVSGWLPGACGAFKCCSAHCRTFPSTPTHEITRPRPGPPPSRLPGPVPAPHPAPAGAFSDYQAGQPLVSGALHGFVAAAGRARHRARLGAPRDAEILRLRTAPSRPRCASACARCTHA